MSGPLPERFGACYIFTRSHIFTRGMTAVPDILLNAFSRTYAVLLDALNRHRGKGQQKVTVEHVVAGDSPDLFTHFLIGILFLVSALACATAPANAQERARDSLTPSEIFHLRSECFRLGEA